MVRARCWRKGDLRGSAQVDVYLGEIEVEDRERGEGDVPG